MFSRLKVAGCGASAGVQIETLVVSALEVVRQNNYDIYFDQFVYDSSVKLRVPIDQLLRQPIKFRHVSSHGGLLHHSVHARVCAQDRSVRLCLGQKHLAQRQLERDGFRRRSHWNRDHGSWHAQRLRTALFESHEAAPHHQQD